MPSAVPVPYEKIESAVPLLYEYGGLVTALVLFLIASLFFNFYLVRYMREILNRVINVIEDNQKVLSELNAHIKGLR